MQLPPSPPDCAEQCKVGISRSQLTQVLGLVSRGGGGQSVLVPPPGVVVLDHSLNLIRSQFKNCSDGLQHVVPTADICAEHVVEDDILQILLTGSLPGGHPLQSSHVVLQLLNPVLKC